MSNPQPTAAPITPEEIAALRDALAKATQGDLAPKLLAALDAAEAQAVKFAWDALAFAGVCVNSESGIYDDCANSSAESAAEYLAERKLLRRSGWRTWQRVEGK